MSILKKLAGQTAIYGISSILGRMLNFLLTPFYTEVFDPAFYGILSIFFTIIAFVSIVVTFGMETTFFRFSEDYEDSNKAYNQAFIFIGFLVGIILIPALFFYSQVSYLIDPSYDPQFTLAVLIILTLDIIAALPMAKLRRENRAKRFAWINITNIIISVTGNIIFIFVLGFGLKWVFFVNIFASALRLSLALWSGGLPTEIKPDKKSLQKMVHYGFFIMLAGTAGTINEHLDKILLLKLWPKGGMLNGKIYTGDELVGIYAACYKLSVFIALVTQAFRYAAEPFFFKHAKDKDSPETFAKVFHYFIIACLACFLLVSSFSHEIAELVLRRKSYHVGLGVVPILLLAYVFSAAYTTLSIWFKITKQTRFALVFAGAGATVTIIINLLTIPKYGYWGSAWATLAAYSLMAVLVYKIGQKHYPIPYKITRISLYFILVLAVFFINYKIGSAQIDGLIDWVGIFGKSLVCLAAGAAVWAGEKWKPVFGMKN